MPVAPAARAPPAPHLTNEKVLTKTPGDINILMLKLLTVQLQWNQYRQPSIQRIQRILEYMDILILDIWKSENLN